VSEKRYNKQNDVLFIGGNNMARKAVLEGGKKDEILNVALELFLKNGYENTSIRMILERVGGEVGMFYHYFDSKQEVFDKAFQHFMKKQGELEAMFPAFKKILFALMQSDEVSAPYKMEWHARFLFQGIGGVLHENSFEKITKEQRVDFILKLIGKTLEIPQCRFEAPFYIK